MKVIICGAGGVGTTLAQHLLKEKNDITIIDQSEENLREIKEHLDVNTYVGFGSQPGILDKAGAKKLALKMLEHGGKIIDNKFIGKIAYAQAISGDIENSLNTIKTMELGFDYSQALINIANKISLQQEDLQTSYH